MKSSEVHQDEQAVSDVVGTVLLLGITVVMFAGLSLAVYQDLDRAPAPPITDFRLDTSNSRTTIIPTWGEHVLVKDIQIILEKDGVRQRVNLMDAPLSTSLVHRSSGSTQSWDIGEPLRLGCPVGESCAYPGSFVTNVTVVHVQLNSVVFSSERGVSRGLLVNNIADLTANVESFVDPLRQPSEPFYNGGSFQLKSKIANSGLVATPPSTTIKVQYFLDFSQTPFFTNDRAGPLAAGAFYNAENPAYAISTGAHTVRVRVDGVPTVPEGGYGNNERIYSLNVVAGLFDPGQPYEDGNNDGLYNPYTTNDGLIPTADVRDGKYKAGGQKGLVIPPSVGALSVSTGEIKFETTNGQLLVAINLETTNNKPMTLDSGGALKFVGPVEIISGEVLTVKASTRIDMVGVTFDTQNRNMLVTATAGPIVATNAKFYKSSYSSDPDDVTITSGATADFTGAVFKALDDIILETTGDMTLTNGNMDAGDKIVLDVDGAAFKAIVGGVSINDADDCADLDPNTATYQGTPASGRVATVC